MNINITKLAIVSLIALLLSACLYSSHGPIQSIKEKLMKDKKTPWETYIFAPRHYPAELVAGESFWMYDNGSRIGFSGYAGGGWRSAGAQAGGGSYLPDGVNLTWLSPIEGKYYHVRARIPKEAILKEFDRKLSRDTADKLYSEKFKEINFALSPGGFVSMRLEWAQKKEVAQFQAEEVDIPWEYFAEANHFDPEGLSEEKYLSGFIEKTPDYVKEQIKNNDIPVNRWKNFNTNKFPWHLNSSLDIKGYTEFLINGEKQFIVQPELDSFSPSDKKAVPAWYRVYFKRDGKRYRANFILTRNDPDQLEQPDGDVEIYNIFDSFFKKNPTSASMVLDIKNGEPIAYLTNGDDRQMLPLYNSDYRELKDDEYLWFK